MAQPTQQDDARATFTTAMYVFTLVRDTPDHEPIDRWTMALATVRQRAQDSLIQWVAQMFLGAYQRHQGEERIDEVLDQQSLLMCMRTIGSVVTLLRDARQLDPKGDLTWLATGVTRELKSFDSSSHLVARIISRGDTVMLFLKKV